MSETMEHRTQSYVGSFLTFAVVFVAVGWFCTQITF
jgi:hypothetical protein